MPSLRYTYSEEEVKAILLNHTLGKLAEDGGVRNWPKGSRGTASTNITPESRDGPHFNRGTFEVHVDITDK